MLSPAGYAELLELRREFADLRFEWEFAKLRLRRKFDPNQPRVPAGNSDGGQWTDAGGGQGTDNAQLTDSGQATDLSAVRRRGPQSMPPLSLPHFSPNRDAVSDGMQREPITITNNAQTGISTIDETTAKLVSTLEKVVNALPQGSGPEYGTQVHTEFANAIRSQNLRGIGSKGVERTFGLDPDDPYGAKDSIRTDIALRNDIGDVIAIYDVKTGNATLRAGRVQELRSKTGASLSVPVIEMHVQRGLSLKARVIQAKYRWLITARLWNPWVLGIDKSAN